jgi:hypothetical protein
MSETRVTFLGVIATEPGEAIAINAPPNADAATIAKAVEQAEAQKAAETAKLREIFLSQDRRTDDE